MLFYMMLSIGSLHDIFSRRPAPAMLLIFTCKYRHNICDSQIFYNNIELKKC